MVERPYPIWTVARCNEIMHDPATSPEQLKALADCELLAESWRNTIQKRIERGGTPDISKRVIGPNEWYWE